MRVKKQTRYSHRQKPVPRPFIWAAAGILSAMGLILLAFYLWSRTSNEASVTSFGGLSVARPTRVEEPAAPRSLVGDRYQIADVGAVAATNAVLFIDSAKPNYVFWMNLNENGEQVGEIKPLPLGATIHNPRGISQLGSRYLIVGDLAAPVPAGSSELLAFTVDADKQTITSVQGLTGLRSFLLENVPELKNWTQQTGEKGGLLVDALSLSLDPQAPQLLLGFRRPLINNNALVVPLRFIHPGSPLTLDSLQLAHPNAYQVPLSGQGIRGLRYDNHLKSYLVISGASDDLQNDSFMLWEWNGESNAASQKLFQLDAGMRPGGLARVKIAERQYIFIAGEESSYTKMEYAKE